MSHQEQINNTQHFFCEVLFRLVFTNFAVVKASLRDTGRNAHRGDDVLKFDSAEQIKR